MPSLYNSRFDPGLPYWRDYLPFLQRLAGPEFPGCTLLNAMLPGGLNSAGGHLIRFVASDELEDGAYEQRIYTTGRVSTRPRHWHDLFNALAWMRFPRIKTAMNSLHYHAGPANDIGARGPLRDALTLFDECGVIVLSERQELLDALARRRWRDAFLADGFEASTLLTVIGHAMLEKYLSPYKAMTANALLLQVEPGFLALPRQTVLERLDRALAEQMLAGRILQNTACLSPLPLAGVPGWWPLDAQGEDDFYADRDVFREPATALKPAPVHRLAA